MKPPLLFRHPGTGTAVLATWRPALGWFLAAPADRRLHGLAVGYTDRLRAHLRRLGYQEGRP